MGCDSTKRKAWDRAYYLAHKEEIAARNQRWAEENRDRSNAIKRRHDKSNPLSVARSKSKWASANKSKTNAKAARHRAAKRNAAPSWGDQPAIALFYANCPTGFQVDHIVPLRGILPCGARVSGLHVIGNLRYLPASKNQSRRNRMSPEEVLEVCRG